MFLLLIFMIIATTLINPNALKLVLPKSSNQLKDKAITTVSIEQKGAEYIYYVELDKVSGIEGVERALKKYVQDGTEAKGQKCPNCGHETLVYQEGCLICKHCGSSRCG